MKKRITTAIIGLIPVFIIIFSLSKGIASNIRLKNVCTKEVEANLVRADERYFYNDSVKESRNYRKEYTSSYAYIVNNKTYIHYITSSEYPEEQIILKYNPNNPDEACTSTGVKGLVIMLCIMSILGGVVFYLSVFGGKKVEEEPNKSIKSFFEIENKNINNN